MADDKNKNKATERNGKDEGNLDDFEARTKTMTDEERAELEAEEMAKKTSDSDLRDD
jgi:hypothetical protein